MSIRPISDLDRLRIYQMQQRIKFGKLMSKPQKYTKNDKVKKETKDDYRNKIK